MRRRTGKTEIIMPPEQIDAQITRLLDELERSLDRIEQAEWKMESGHGS